MEGGQVLPTYWPFTWGWGQRQSRTIPTQEKWVDWTLGLKAQLYPRQRTTLQTWALCEIHTSHAARAKQKSSGGVSPKSPGKSLVKDFVNFSRSLDTCSWQLIPSWDHTYMNIRMCVCVCTRSSYERTLLSSCYLCSEKDNAKALFSAIGISFPPLICASFIEKLSSVCRIESWLYTDLKDERICFPQLQLPASTHPYHRGSCELISSYSHHSVFKVLREQSHISNLPLFLRVHMYHKDITVDVNVSHFFVFQWIAICTTWRLLSVNQNLLRSGHNVDKEAQCWGNTYRKMRKLMGPFFWMKKIM